MRFFFDMEGNGTGNGNIYIYAQGLTTGKMYPIYKSPTYLFPRNMFAFGRMMVSLNSAKETFKLFIEGIYTNII